MSKSRLGWLMLLALLVPTLLTGCPPTPEPEDGTTTTVELGITINLLTGPPGTVEQSDVEGSKSVDKANHIRWFNQTAVQQTVVFAAENWPFMESFGDIVIEAGAHSPWFTMNPEATVGTPHPYNVTPLLDDGAPGEPAITDGP